MAVVKKDLLILTTQLVRGMVTVVTVQIADQFRSLLNLLNASDVHKKTLRKLLSSFSKSEQHHPLMNKCISFIFSV